MVSGKWYVARGTWNVVRGYALVHVHTLTIIADLRVSGTWVHVHLP